MLSTAGALGIRFRNRSQDVVEVPSSRNRVYEMNKRWGKPCLLVKMALAGTKVNTDFLYVAGSVLPYLPAFIAAAFPRLWVSTLVTFLDFAQCHFFLLPLQ